MTSKEKNHPDPQRALERRQQVLDAAKICFSRSGFHGASMAEISKAAGMSAGHIYNYFDSKDAIIAAFVQQNMERVGLILSDVEQHADPLQAIYDSLEQSVLRQLDPVFWTLPLEVFAEASRNPVIAALVRAADVVSHDRLRAILLRGRALRGLPLLAVELDGRMEVMIAMFQGLHLRALHNPSLDVAAVTAALRLAFRPLLMDK